MAVYGYARCSTDETKQDISRQIRELKDMGVLDDSKIYMEYASGTKADRPEFTKLLNVIEHGDTLIATEVSRLSRSMKDLLKILDVLKDKRIKVILGSFVLDFSKGDADPMVIAMIQMMGVFSEMERNMISARTKSGMANAKAKGSKIGRAEGEIIKLDNEFKEYYKMYKISPKVMSKSKIHKLTGLSRVTVDKYIKLLDDNPDML